MLFGSRGAAEALAVRRPLGLLLPASLVFVIMAAANQQPSSTECRLSSS